MPPGQGEILRKYLQALRVDVAVAQSPAAAIQHLRRQPVHAVLCALGPPGGGGTAVVRALRRGGWPTPVILVTGDGEAPRGAEWLAAGRDGAMVGRRMLIVWMRFWRNRVDWPTWRR